MRYQRALDAVLGSATRLALARIVIGSPSKTWTGRELARTSGISPAQVNRDLDRLFDAGMVTFEVVGRSHAWRLNREHLLTQVLTRLFSEEATTLSDLVSALAQELKGSAIEEARLFGSVARGEGADDSDIDLYVQIRSERDREAVEERLHAISSRIWSRYGNALSTLVYTNQRASRPPNPRLLENIKREGIPIPIPS
jgi:predicted nucleotidyltransferase